MLSIKTWKCAESATNYYTHEQPELEYYATDGENTGVFQGLEVFGVTENSVTPEAMTNLLKGCAPNGKPLVQRAGDNHRPGYDLTFSAPKSVSVLWALGDEKTKKSVFKAHQFAVNEALSHVEKYAGKARRGKNGVRLEAVRNLMFAKFDHGTSRENDPQLHTHCLLFNLAQRPDGSFGAIESRYIYEEKMAAGAIYRAELAHNLEQTLGCQTERKDAEFVVKGVSKELCDSFSTRRMQITSDMLKTGYSSPESAVISALTTRKPKERISISQLEDAWKERGSGFNFRKVLGRSGLKKSSLDEEKILLELTKTQSTFTNRDVRKAVAQGCQTITNRVGFESHYAKIMSRNELVCLGQDKKGVARYTTKEIFNLEQEMLKTVLSGTNNSEHQIKISVVAKAIREFENKKDTENSTKIKLTPEQNKMVYDLTTEAGSTKIALGIAGSGKSFALEAAKDAWQKAGFSVIGMAPTGKASLGLEQSTGIKSSTIDSFLARQRGKNSRSLISKKSILVVDEAGMIGSRKLFALTELVKKSKAKLILVGDTRQLQPVEAGSAVKMIERHIGSIDLTKIYRQKQEWQRNTTQFFADGEGTKAIKEYQKRGMVEIYQSPEQAFKGIFNDYLKQLKRNPTESKLIITETNDQAKALNLAIKEALRREGRTNSGQEIPIKVKENGNEMRHFAAGERIIFTKNRKKMGVTNGTFGTVLDIKNQLIGGQRLTVKLDSNEKISFDVKDYGHIDNGFAVTIYKSQGETVDRTQFFLSEKTSREAAYVAMSRHRKSAKIYIDRSSFSDLIDWNEVSKMKKTAEITNKIEQKTIEMVGRKSSTSQQKDTSLDYKKSRDYGVSR